MHHSHALPLAEIKRLVIDRTDFVVVGDLILVEVLQGLRVDADYVAAKALLWNEADRTAETASAKQARRDECMS